jgi:DNA mismatch repair protein MutS
MVEMSETALILNQATERSLVLLDEIGRGTSTLDGLSIACSVAEAIHDRIRSRTVFATHYHELVGLADERASAFNMHVGVREWGKRVVFLRTLKSGGASKSYGIQCARLAGMPDSVVQRASQLLGTLEKERAKQQGPQMTLFGGQGTEGEATESPPEIDRLREALLAIDPDELSPKEALAAIYSLKEIVG